MVDVRFTEKTPLGSEPTGAAATSRGLNVPVDVRGASVDGARLVYREVGAGDPVVFVHGGISDLTIWDAQLPVIGSGHRAIAYSRRYAWPNEDLPAGERDTMRPHVDDLLAFLRATDARPAHLVGNSWGAFICLMAAIREPDSVRSLVLEEPPLVPLIMGNPPSPINALKAIPRHPLVALAVLGFGARTLVPVTAAVKAGDIESGEEGAEPDVGGSLARFARGVIGEAAYEKLPGDVRAHMRANASTHVGQFLADGGFESITESQIRSVRRPALVVTGSDSPAALRRLAGLLASLLPNARRLDVPAATHLMHLQNSAAFNAGLLEFLDSERTQRGLT
ncbi:MAG: alpha/beta hydrolase [Chloroflexota bacterium]